MKVLIINGSPKGRTSNSLRLAASFVEGLREELEGGGEQVLLDEVDVYSLSIAPCKGCFGCWRATPGTCVIQDDMTEVLQKRVSADLIVWSFPLYFFSVPGGLKNLIDRQLPMTLPFMQERTDGYGSGSHPTRYDMSGIRNVVVSTCGFYSAEGNYDSVRSMLDHSLGKGNYTEVFCGQGELFRIKELTKQTDAYLASVRQAGREYAAGGITAATEARLRELILPKEVFEAQADASWGIDKETGEKNPDDLIFTQQMAALYNPESHGGHDRVLEMRYTDTGHTYQLRMGSESCEVLVDGGLEPTTTIETTYELWRSISRGEIGGAEALGQGLYRVTGDFQTMVRWDTYFDAGQSSSSSGAGSAGAGAQDDAQQGELNPPSMANMLVPWIAFWVAVSIDAAAGALVTLAITVLTFAFASVVRSQRLVIWDWVSSVAVMALSLVAYFTGQGDAVTTAGYLVFGLMWLASCLTSEDLCATYVKHGFGGESALRNPLFTRTTRILTIAWGVLYVATAAWTFLLRQAGAGNVVLIVNNLVPVGMGVFTAWFQTWYPAHLASR